MRCAIATTGCFSRGQLASLIGTWLTMLATSWLVYRLAKVEYPDQAPLILGVVGFAGQVPIFLLSPWAGVWIDRWSRHRVLVATQSLSMLQSFALAALALSGVIQIWHMLVLNALQGVVNAFDVTARQAFVIELVENRDDLSGAIALNSSMFHSARLLVPAIAGWLISITSEGVCFLIDGFSYLAVLVALLAMRLPPRPAQAATRARPGGRWPKDCVTVSAFHRFARCWCWSESAACWGCRNRC